MVMSNKKIEKLIKSFKKSICQVMYDATSIEEQKHAMRLMISSFNSIGQDRGVPMVQYAVDIINKDFPHLKDELHKLLLLV